MKPKEFYKIMTVFVEEDKRWRALEVGGIVYVERCAEMEFEYCQMTIEKIDLEERVITVRDTSRHIPTTRNINDFLTKAEYDKLFNPLIRN